MYLHTCAWAHTHTLGDSLYWFELAPTHWNFVGVQSTTHPAISTGSLFLGSLCSSASIKRLRSWGLMSVEGSNNSSNRDRYPPTRTSVRQASNIASLDLFVSDLPLGEWHQIWRRVFSPSQSFLEMTSWPHGPAERCYLITEFIKLTMLMTTGLTWSRRLSFWWSWDKLAGWKAWIGVVVWVHWNLQAELLAGWGPLRFSWGLKQI